jgi:hypothetical protein
MGNTTSAPSPPPPTPPSPPIPVITLPVQRSPVEDGASGLHYSGRVYMNSFQALGKDICNGASVGPNQINDVYPNGISTSQLTMDPTTHRISQQALQSYVATLMTNGLVPGQMGSFDDQMNADRAFYSSIQTEYCFYEARYVAALTQFLNIISQPNPDQSAADAALQPVIAINSRLNSLLETMSYIINDRAQKINVRSPAIDQANQQLDANIATLTAQKEFLTSSDATIKTREEMVRYSAEKSRAMNIQIMFFVALNVVALGTVLSVYKAMPPK